MAGGGRRTAAWLDTSGPAFAGKLLDGSLVPTRGDARDVAAAVASKAAQRDWADVPALHRDFVVQPNVGVGGHKHSGLGHEGTLDAMVEHDTRRKSIVIRAG